MHKSCCRNHTDVTRVSIRSRLYLEYPTCSHRRPQIWSLSPPIASGVCFRKRSM